MTSEPTETTMDYTPSSRTDDLSSTGIDDSSSWTYLLNATTTSMTISSTASYHNHTTPRGHEIMKWHGVEILYFFLMMILAIFGNSVVIYIYHFRWRRCNFSLFIQILAALDLINASTTIPLFLALTINDRHPQFDHLCQAASFIAIMTAMASGVVLVIIAFDRNRRICQPLKREISIGLTRKLCFLAMFFGVLLAVPSVFVYGMKAMPFEDNGVRVYIAQCYFADDMIGSPLYWIFMGSLGAVFTGVMTSLAVLYVSMYRALKVHLARRESLGSSRGIRPLNGTGEFKSSGSKTSQFRSQKSSARIFFAVTVAFFSSYFPFFIAVMIFMVKSDNVVMNPYLKALTDIAKNAPLMSNAINPFIYSVSSRRFRKEIIDIWRCSALRRTPSERARVRVHVKSNTSSTGD